MKHHLKIAAVALTMCVVTFVSCSEDDEATTYTVAFETDGGSPVPSAQSVEAGKTATAPRYQSRQIELCICLLAFKRSSDCLQFQYACEQQHYPASQMGK